MAAMAPMAVMANLSNGQYFLFFRGFIEKPPQERVSFAKMTLP